MGWHTFNIAIHALTGLVVLTLARRMLAKDGRLSPQTGSAAALVAALVCVAHPLRHRR